MFKIQGKESEKILVFDLDDTLVRTDAKIKILNRKTKEVLRELTPQEFNQFEKKKGHILNFDDFDSAELLRQGRMIHEIFEILKKSYSKKIPVAILTARSSSELVRDFFLQNGIDIHPELVIAINDPQFKHEGSIPERKKKAIEELIDLGFKDLTFFDDHEDNLKLAKEAEGYKGATVKTIKVY
jgi:hydroxymethylpyrimidine pyrophosphatase-like HAD family hydrolase